MSTVCWTRNASAPDADLHNVGQTTCTVHGYANLQFFNSTDQVAAILNRGRESFGLFDVTPPSLLARGQSASFGIGGANFNNYTQTASPAATVIVTEPPVTPGTRDNVQITLSSPGGTPRALERLTSPRWFQEAMGHDFPRYDDPYTKLSER